MSASAEHRHIVVVGAGFSGIGLAVELREAGFDDLLILERADDLGGTWRANTYPGCACDVPSQLYSYSFAPNPHWSRTYGTQPEILEYLRSVAVRFDMIGCKRAIFSDTYLPALDEPNVNVVTDPIIRVRPHSVVTRGGAEYPVDTIIFGTGFSALPSAFERFVGREGSSVADLYSQQPQSYLGTTLAGFPNFFCTLGPFGAAGNQSAIFMIESQITYIVDALRTARARSARRLELKPGVQDAFLDEMARRSVATVWVSGGCTGYYRAPDGRNAGLYPSWSLEYRSRTKKFDTDSYVVSY